MKTEKLITLLIVGIMYIGQACSSEKATEKNKYGQNFTKYFHETFSEDFVPNGYYYVIGMNYCTDCIEAHLEFLINNRIKENITIVFSGRVQSSSWLQNINKISKYKNSILIDSTKYGGALNRHKEGIINYVIHRVTNAIVERINGKIQNIKNIGRGYRSFQSLRSAILFFNGGLDLYSLKF